MAEREALLLCWDGSPCAATAPGPEWTQYTCRCRPARASATFPASAPTCRQIHALVSVTTVHGRPSACLPCHVKRCAAAVQPLQVVPKLGARLDSRLFMAGMATPSPMPMHARAASSTCRSVQSMLSQQRNPQSLHSGPLTWRRAVLLQNCLRSYGVQHLTSQRRPHMGGLVGPRRRCICIMIVWHTTSPVSRAALPEVSALWRLTTR